MAMMMMAWVAQMMLTTTYTVLPRSFCRFATSITRPSLWRTSLSLSLSLSLSATNVVISKVLAERYYSVVVPIHNCLPTIPLESFPLFLFLETHCVGRRGRLGPIRICRTFVATKLHLISVGVSAIQGQPPVSLHYHHMIRFSTNLSHGQSSIGFSLLVLN